MIHNQNFQNKIKNSWNL